MEQNGGICKSSQLQYQRFFRVRETDRIYNGRFPHTKPTDFGYNQETNTYLQWHVCLQCRYQLIAQGGHRCWRCNNDVNMKIGLSAAPLLREIARVLVSLNLVPEHLTGGRQLADRDGRAPDPASADANISPNSGPMAVDGDGLPGDGTEARGGEPLAPVHRLPAVRISTRRSSSRPRR